MYLKVQDRNAHFLQVFRIEDSNHRLLTHREWYTEHIYQFPGNKRINLDLARKKRYFSNCIHNMTSSMHHQRTRHTSTSIAIHQLTRALDSVAPYLNKTNLAPPKALAWCAEAPPSRLKKCLSAPSPYIWTTH